MVTLIMLLFTRSAIYKFPEESKDNPLKSPSDIPEILKVEIIAVPVVNMTLYTIEVSYIKEIG